MRPPAVRLFLWLLVVQLGAGLPPGGGLLAAQPSRVTAVHNSASTGLENGLYQWEIGWTPAECRFLGKYGLGVTNGAGGSGLFGYDIDVTDVATLSSGDVAVQHAAPGGARVVSVVKPHYDVSGFLSHVTHVATVTPSATHINTYSQIGSLPKEGFVASGGDSGGDLWLLFYKKTGPSNWTETAYQTPVSGETKIFSLAGLFRADRSEAVTCQRFNSTYYCRRYASDTNQLLASYGRSGETYYTHPIEGLPRSELITNGWVRTGLSAWGTDYPTCLYDSNPLADIGGASFTNRIVGRLTNGDGSDIYTAAETACLRDGRLVLATFAGGGATFNVYTMRRDPPNQPAGSVGANGPDFTVTLGHAMANSGSRLCGDYQILPPPRGTVVWFK